MELQGITSALQQGCRLHAFLSGGGLRVVRLEKEGKLKGYGEHPLANDALVHADEDFLAGGRSYQEVYGKKHPHYLTGAAKASNQLDQWMLQGYTFDAWWENDEVVFELGGIQQVQEPKNLAEQVQKTGADAEWESRGFKYLTSLCRSPSGKLGTSTKCLNPRKSIDCWMYDYTKTGRGKSFDEAIVNAFAAPEVEIMKN
jgi:hypothetical protein